LAWYFRALVELQRDDHTGYRHACTRMLDLFEHAARADTAYWTTWTCVIAPDAFADWTKPLKLAEDAHATAPNDYDRINLIGCLLYRAGRIDEAAQRLTEAGGAFTEAPSRRTTIIYNWLFQAMAQYRLGHAAEAANWLEKAAREIDKPSAQHARDSATNPWNRRLTLDLLRREARGLLGKEGA
jgi:tetratricopeptide (TPR) repeat protein